MTNDAKGMEDVTTTEYSFEYFRDPVVRLGDGDAKDDEREESAIKRNGLWTRSVGFEKVQARAASNEWRYATKSERAVCEKEHGFPPHPRKTNHHHHQQRRKRKKTKTRKPKIAQTNQGYSKETRTPGSNKKPVAGNEEMK